MGIIVVLATDDSAASISAHEISSFSEIFRYFRTYKERTLIKEVQAPASAKLNFIHTSIKDSRWTSHLASNCPTNLGSVIQDLVNQNQLPEKH